MASSVWHEEHCDASSSSLESVSAMFTLERDSVETEPITVSLSCGKHVILLHEFSAESNTLSSPLIPLGIFSTTSDIVVALYRNKAVDVARQFHLLGMGEDIVSGLPIVRSTSSLQDEDIPSGKKISRLLPDNFSIMNVVVSQSVEHLSFPIFCLNPNTPSDLTLRSGGLSLSIIFSVLQLSPASEENSAIGDATKSHVILRPDDPSKVDIPTDNSKLKTLFPKGDARKWNDAPRPKRKPWREPVRYVPEKSEDRHVTTSNQPSPITIDPLASMNNSSKQRMLCSQTERGETLSEISESSLSEDSSTAQRGKSRKELNEVWRMMSNDSAATSFPVSVNDEMKDSCVTGENTENNLQDGVNKKMQLNETTRKLGDDLSLQNKPEKSKTVPTEEEYQPVLDRFHPTKLLAMLKAALSSLSMGTSAMRHALALVEYLHVYITESRWASVVVADLSSAFFTQMGTAISVASSLVSAADKVAADPLPLSILNATQKIVSLLRERYSNIESVTNATVAKVSSVLNPLVRTSVYLAGPTIKSTVDRISPIKDRLLPPLRVGSDSLNTLVSHVPIARGVWSQIQKATFAVYEDAVATYEDAQSSNWVGEIGANPSSDSDEEATKLRGIVSL